MNQTDQNFPMVAKTLSGLEDILADELTRLGAKKVKPAIRSVEFEGDTKTLYKANIWCRTTTRILKPILKFHAIDGEQLYAKIIRINWSNYFNVNKTIAVDALSTYSKLENTLFIAQKTKDAIVDQFREKFNKRPSVDTKNPQIKINIHIIKNEVTVALDSSGDPLSKRGYRLEKGQAPLSEILAAGIIYLTDWDKSSSFIDPMCGSGTFVIEAALMARNIAPGLIRKAYAFQNWNDYDAKLYDNICHTARKVVIKSVPIQIVGSDIDGIAIKDAVANARRAGVDRDIRFERNPMDKQTVPPPPGIAILNPPYGERMKQDDISLLYKSIGDCFKQSYSGYKAFILSGNMKAIKTVGLRASQKIKLYNGPLECRLLRYEMYEGTKKQK
ncbi:MAG: THUMP domain-containing protein [Candidatus Zixiibacteriota bacterium]